MPEVKLEEVKRFMVESLVAAGAPESEATEHACLLLAADTCGHFSHGLNRLECYVNDIQKGVTKPAAKPVILKESAATAWVDGCDALGATVGNFCINVAMNKAKQAGIGIVTVKRSCHFGMAGYWAQKALQEGLIGMAFTNSGPMMVPTRAKQSAMGTNPMALAAATGDGDTLVTDMAATAVAFGKIEVQVHKGEPIPEGWALGPDGNVTTDAQLAFDTAKLLPLGGFEQTSGYKGYALSALVEVLCSVLSGARPSHEVQMWVPGVDSPTNLGQCFLAIDPACFAPGFGERLAHCLRYWRELEPVDPSLPVLAPGDKERINTEATKSRGTITYAPNQITSCNVLAKRLSINALEVV